MRIRIVSVCVAAGLLAMALVLPISAGISGNLEPPGPPESTYSYTLEDIYNRLNEGTQGAPGTFTEPSTGPGTGTGYTLDEVMAKAPVLDEAQGAVASDVAQGKTFWGLTAGGWGLMTGTATRADPPCFDNANRYVDCGNGTVTDTVFGLIWLKDATCFTRGYISYAVANEAAAGLAHGQCGLTDHSSPGDWRLPTADEWFTTLARARDLGCTSPALTNTPGTNCFADGPEPFTGVPSGLFGYWSSSSVQSMPDLAVYLELASGLYWGVPKTSNYNVWPVRGGP